ncbi:MAG: DUF5684 domain-containing protein [Coriobacteriia bacterium]|nr:DUF5684 domain-containing protein [Coriobacteriia bacterium]
MEYYGQEEALVFLMAYSVVSVIIGIGMYILVAFFLMKIFAKANVPAWKAWVPIVNCWKFLELGGYHGALCLLALIPFVGGILAVVFMCMAAYQIGLKLGKEAIWVVLYIFLSIVWMGIMAFSAAQWRDSLGRPALGAERPPA